MGYSYARLNVLVLAEILKSLHFAERLVYVELAVVVNECYSRTVIPSVFRTMESSDEDVVSVPSPIYPTIPHILQLYVYTF